jgi:predicted DNA binding CopG/RHH family protein
MSEIKGKPLPNLTTDEDAERWLESADLSEYDLSRMKPFASEFRLKDARVNMRLPHYLLTQLKTAAEREGIPYQRLMRELLERGLAQLEGRQALKKKAS